MDAGKMSYAPKSFSAVTVIDDIANSLEQLCNSKQLKAVLSSEIADDLFIWADPFRFKQILLNLISNAVKFTQRGSITLSVVNTDIGIEISVKDQGVGIAKDKLPLLFQAFSQADSSISRDFGGTGLGLYISRALADAMQMTLVVQSELQQGSIFTLTVPQKLISIETPEPHIADEAPLAELPPLHNAKHLLIVDDVKDIRDLIASFLQRTGLTLTFAKDGLQAVDLCQQQEFDLIIMDRQMPRMDGITAATRIRQLGFTKPIIQLSADVFTHQEEKAPFNCLLTKPFNQTTLLQSINQLLNTAIAAPQPVKSVLEDDEDLLREYLNSLSAQLDKLKQILQEEAYEQLAIELHKIKGTSACLGLTNISKAAMLAETKVKNRQLDPMLLADLVLQVESENT